MVRCLTKRGAVVDKRGEGDETALHAAVTGNHTGIVSLLLELGAEVGGWWQPHGRSPTTRLTLQSRLTAGDGCLHVLLTDQMRGTAMAARLCMSPRSMAMPNC